jgi:hypothetical protein
LQPNNFSQQEIAGFYRFAVLLSGVPETARLAVLEVLDRTAEKLEHMRNEKDCKVWLMARLRERLLAATHHAGENAMDAEPAGRFSKIPEPGRSALALLYLDLFSARDIAQILQIPMGELPGAMDSARAFLNGPAQQAAAGKNQPLWKCHRPENAELQDARIQKAVRLAEGSTDSKTALDTQTTFDDAQVALIRGIVPDGDFLQKLDAILREPHGVGFHIGALRQPPFIAGAVAVLVVIGVLIYVGINWAENFPGKETAVRMLDMTDEMTGIELELKAAEAGSLGDWFFNKGYDGFHMLPEFAHMKTVGCRVFPLDGYQVGQIAIENHNLLLYFFDAGDFGVKIEPPDRWQYFQQGEWTAAIRADGGTCYMATFRGEKSDMENFLAGLGK